MSGGRRRRKRSEKVEIDDHEDTFGFDDDGFREDDAELDGLDEDEDLDDDEDDDLTDGRGWSGQRTWYPPPAPRLPPPAHGIRVKKIGSTWWGQRWIAALEGVSGRYANRLPRGRGYARAGRVHDLVVREGTVRARVTGSRRTPYAVTLRVGALSAAVWSKATAEMAKQAVFSAQLLAGAMPAEIDEAFRRAGASLFPTQRRELATDCSCPDVANPCKHVAAVHYVLGEAFDKDPFLLFELRGRTKAQVLGALRRARGGDGIGGRPRGGSDKRVRPRSVASAMPTVRLDASAAATYERGRAPLTGWRFRIEAPTARATALRSLGAPASWSIAEPIVDLLGPAYEAAGSLARRLAISQDEEPPAAQPERAQRQRDAHRGRP